MRLRWPFVTLVAVLVAGLVGTHCLGRLQSQETVQLWGYVLAFVLLVLGRFRPQSRGRSSGDSEPPSLGPLGVLAAGDAVHWTVAAGWHSWLSQLSLLQ